MSLKEEINKSDKLKNDLKLAKNNINDRILSGGGTKANTISEVPSKIDEMLGNYKKVAQSSNKYINDINVYDNLNKIYTIPINCGFSPKIFFLQMTPRYFGLDANTWQKVYKGGTFVSNFLSDSFEYEVIELTEKNVKIKFVNSSDTGVRASCLGWFATN